MITTSVLNIRKRTEVEQSQESAIDPRSRLSEYLESPQPIVVTDSLNHVVLANRAFETAIGVPVSDAVGSNVLEVIAAAKSDAVPNSETITPLELIAVASNARLVWRLVQAPDENATARRPNRPTAELKRDATGGFIRIDSAEPSINRPIDRSVDRSVDRSRSTTVVTHSREQVLACLEEERLRSLVPRLTSLFGHLHLASRCLATNADPSRTPSTDQLSRSIDTAKDESEQIAELFREIRNLRQSAQPQPSSHDLRSLFDRCLRLLADELDDQAIELKCTERMNVLSTAVIADGLAVCHAVLWLLRTATASIALDDRRILMDCLVEDGQLRVGVSFNRDGQEPNATPSSSGTLNFSDDSVETDHAIGRLDKPAVPTTWQRSNLANGRSTLTVTIPCIRGVK